MADNISSILKCLKLLVGKEQASRNDEKNEKFWKYLEFNLNACEKYISSEESLSEEVSRSEYSITLLKDERPRDLLENFVLKSLTLLHLLSETLLPRKHVASHPPVSLGDCRVVETVLQGVIYMGACPLLEVGVAPSLHARLKTENLTFLKEVPPSQLSPKFAVERLYLISMILVEWMGVEADPGPAVTPCFLPEVLAMLIKLTHERKTVQLLKEVIEEGNKHRDDSAPFTEPKKWLNDILLKVQHPLLVQELFLLQSPKPAEGQEGRRHLVPAPKWLRSACGKVLTHILLKPNGLVAVIEGFLRSTSQGDSPEWKRYQVLAGIVSTCPARMERQAYLKEICPQVVDMIERSSSKPLLVASHAILTAFLDKFPAEANECLLHSLILPLRVIAGEIDAEECGVSEQQLTVCLSTLRKMLNLSQSDSPVVQSLIPYLSVLFSLWGAAKKTISHVKAELQALVVGLLLCCDKNEIVSFFGHLAGLKGGGGDSVIFRTCREDIVVKMGDEGGVCVKFADQPSQRSQDVVDNTVQLAIELLRDHLTDRHVCGPVFLMCFEHLSNLLLSSKSTSDKGSHTPHSNPSPLLESTTVSTTTSLFCLCITAGLCEECLQVVLSEVLLDQLLSTIEVLIQVHSEWVQHTSREVVISEQPHHSEPFGSHLTLTMATGLLSAVLSSDKRVHTSHRALLQSMVPGLRTLANMHPMDELAMSCNDLHVCIATLGAVWNHSNHGDKKVESRDTSPDPLLRNDSCSSTKDSDDSKFKSALSMVSGSTVPIRAQGLHDLTELVRASDPYTAQHFGLLLEVFKQQLKDRDSFVYLAAINGLVAMVTLSPQKTIPVLVNEFVRCPQRARSSSVQQTKIDSVSSEFELQVKLGEALMKAARSCGEVLPVYLDQFMKACVFGTGHAHPLVRASSLSNLGELCHLLHYSVPSVLQEVLTAVENALIVEKEATVRRAGALAVKMLFAGLDKDIVEVLQGSLKDFYHILKKALTTETDDLTRSHILSALGELERIMRDLLFPQQTFKKKISIISPK